MANAYQGDGWRWDPAWHPVPYVPTILVIERKPETYDEYADRKSREANGVKHVAFGFGAREPEPEPGQPPRAAPAPAAEWEGNPS